MCEPETKVPQPHSPSPSHAAPRFQLQPSTPPEISTRHASNPNLLKRMQESICFKCREKGHWSWYCPLKSPNNNNLSPVSTKRILCRCGHGFCDVKTAHSSNNWGRDYFVCPIKRDVKTLLDGAMILSRRLICRLLCSSILSVTTLTEARPKLDGLEPKWLNFLIEDKAQ